MDRRRTTPVLVVGAGPAGLAAAAELAYHGIECVLVEPRQDVSADRPRAKTTSARTMELFRRWGVAHEIRRAAPLPASWSDSVIFCDALLGHELTRFTNCFGLGYATNDERFAEGGQQIPQPLMERVLRRHVGRQSGIEMLLGASVVSLAEDDDGVDVQVRLDDGRHIPVRAGFVLGCDGANGVVRRSLGIGYVGRSDDRPNFNAVFRAPTLDTPLGRAVQYWVVGSRTSGVLGRLDLDGTWWAIAPGVDAVIGRAEVARILADLVGGPFEHEVLSTDPWSARMLLAERFSSGPAGRTFLVGEAAHLNPPWGGHGYNTCVGDAVNIGWKIAAVIQGWGTRELLDSYEVERRPIARDTIATAETNMGTLSTDLADLATGPGATRLPTLSAAIQASKRAEFQSLGLVLGSSYAGSPVVQDGPGHVIGDSTQFAPSSDPGSRLPHAWIDERTSLYDGLGRGMTVLGPLHRAQHEIAELERRAAVLGIPLRIVESPSHYPWADEFLLIRPDQHIAGRAESPRGLDLTTAVGRKVQPASFAHVSQEQSAT
jgi:2-polyprenyl-6-methoxyphenol hydroxylase-like FAD-dependent oxidoreductase